MIKQWIIAWELQSTKVEQSFGNLILSPPNLLVSPPFDTTIAIHFNPSPLRSDAKVLGLARLCFWNPEANSRFFCAQIHNGNRPAEHAHFTLCKGDKVTSFLLHVEYVDGTHAFSIKSVCSIDPSSEWMWLYREIEETYTTRLGERRRIV
jgi:hypothetical protein